MLILLTLLGCSPHGTDVMPVPIEQYPDAEMISFEGYAGYLVMPQGEGPWPAVVMVHEWWGLNQNIKNMAHELAREGFVVLAVDLYGETTDSSTRARSLMRDALDSEDTLANMQAAVRYLEQLGVTGVGVMGWCFGGGMALQLSLVEDLDATVIYYGSLVTDERLAQIMSPVLGIFGADDSSIPVEDVLMFEEKLEELGVEHDIRVYEGVGHAFANPSNPGHDVEKAQDAWGKTVAFLNGHLRGP